MLQGCDRYKKLVDRYDWDKRVAMAVMRAESGCRANAVGDNYPIRGLHAVSCGLFQVRTVAKWRGTCKQLQKPSFNVKIAHKVYKGQGWKAWSVINNGKYLRYLK